MAGLRGSPRWVQARSGSGLASQPEERRRKQGMRTEGKEVKAWALGIIQYALSTKNLVTTQITIMFVLIHYVTGRKGRVSKATRLLCKEHAHKFAIKYRLTLF